MITDTVEFVSVEWIMKNVGKSVDADISTPNNFFDMMLYKSWDACFAPLVHDIMDNGIMNPVCIVNRSDGFIFGNGHHRLVAAILLCMDTIPVYWSDEDYMCSEYTDSEPWEYDYDSDNIATMLT
jgi:hypothetical protein